MSVSSKIITIIYYIKVQLKLPKPSQMTQLSLLWILPVLQVTDDEARIAPLLEWFLISIPDIPPNSRPVNDLLPVKLTWISL